jgi:Cu/Ag efflux protein CusF
MNGMPRCLLLSLAVGLLVGLTLSFAEEKREEQATETVKGRIQRIAAEQNQFLLRDQEGREWMVRLGRDAKVQVNDKESQFADLKEGDDVTVTVVRMARDIRSEERARDVQAIHGQIRKVAPDQNQITIRDESGKELTFHIERDAKLRLNDKECRLGDLQTGDHVSIMFEKRDEALQARDIRSERGEHAAHRTQGQIERVAADQKQLVLKDQAGKQRRFQLSRDAKVQVGGKEVRLADLKQGDEVTVAYQLMAQAVRSERKE